MKQGEIRATGGKWTGSSSGGVNAPDPVVLPDLTRRFVTTATRMEALAQGHPAEAWLNFLARLSRAQHQAAQALQARAATDPALSGPSPIMADATWRKILRDLLDHMSHEALPEAARGIQAALAAESEMELDERAEGFLHGEIAPKDLGHAFFIAAALQVHFTAKAARQNLATVTLQEHRGLCPTCGSTPVAGLVTAMGRTPGCRYLHCSLCSTAWNHVRAVCIHCGQAGKLSLQSIEGSGELAKAETCGHCGTYSKVLYQKADTRADPVADDLATVSLDVLVAGEGWSRHAPNPLMLSL